MAIFYRPKIMLPLVAVCLTVAKSQIINSDDETLHLSKVPELATSFLHWSANQSPNYDLSKQWLPHRLRDIWHSKTAAIVERRFFDYVDSVIREFSAIIDGESIYEAYHNQLCIGRPEVPMTLTASASDGSILTSSAVVRVKHNSCRPVLRVEPLYNQSEVFLSRTSPYQYSLTIRKGVEVVSGAVPVMFRGPIEIAVPASGSSRSSRTLYGDMTAVVEVSFNTLTSWDNLRFTVNRPLFNPWVSDLLPVTDACLEAAEGRRRQKKPWVSCQAISLTVHSGKSQLCVPSPEGQCPLGSPEVCDKLCLDIRRRTCSLVETAYPEMFDVKTALDVTLNESPTKNEGFRLPLCQSQVLAA